MAIYGYVRVSTSEQNEDRQTIAMTEFAEVINTGAIAEKWCRTVTSFGSTLATFGRWFNFCRIHLITSTKSPNASTLTTVFSQATSQIFRRIRNRLWAQSEEIL